jgi:hypothetical protein
MIWPGEAIFVVVIAFTWYPNLPASGASELQLGQKAKEMTEE